MLKNKFLLGTLLLAVAVLLFVLSFIVNQFYNNRSALSDEVRDAESYLHRQQRDFVSFLQDTALVKRLIEGRESEKELLRLAEKPYGTFLYTVSSAGNLSLRFWSSQLILPPAKTFAAGDMEELMHLENGHYLVQKKAISAGEHTVVAYALVPVRSAFFFETQNLPERFVYSRLPDERVALSMSPTDFPVKALSGKTIYYLDRPAAGYIAGDSRLTILLRLGGLLLGLLFIHMMAETLARRRKWKGVVFLGASLLAIRVLIYLFPGLLNLRQFELFDPTIYGSNIIQRSLGDLLINAVFFCWFVLFTWYKINVIKDLPGRLPSWMRWVSGILALCLLIYSTFILSSVIRSIVADSKISFDVTNFFSLNRYTVVGFFVLAALSLSYYYFTQILFRIIFPLFSGNVWWVYFAIAFSGLAFLTIRSGDPAVLFYIPVLAWLLVYTGLMNREETILTRIRINIAGVLFWIFIFSVSIAAIMLIENKQAELKQRRFYAGKLAEQTDPSSERTMSIALRYLDNDFLEDNFYRFRDSIGNLQLRDSIVSSNYSGYLNKYDTRLYIYDAAGRPLYNDDGASFAALNNIVTTQAHPTSVPDLYFYETSFDKFAYITQRVVTDSINSTLGYFFIISNPRKYSNDGLFPEFFNQHNANSPENSPIYSYAVYSQGKLIAVSNKYPFPTRLTEPVDKIYNEFERKENGGYDEVWYRASNKRVVIMARKQDTLIESITLFSYIFCSFLFLVFVVQVLSLLIKALFDWDAFLRFFHFNIRNQVHSTIIFISIFSFIIIGIATINFFENRYNRTNSDKLSRTVRIMVKEMEKRMGEGGLQERLSTSYDMLTESNLQALANEVSDIHGVDVNIYDLSGDLKVSSDPNVYAKGVLSEKINPVAYYYLHRLKLVEHVQQEKLADLDYMSVYAPVRDKDGNAYAYLSIPYFASQPELNQEISNFIVTVINLNAFILLVAGLIALVITNRITRSFSVISDKMQQVNLGKMNEAIVWNRDDEIGDLVKEYNKMVGKLEESADALAKTEREGAWREMARQVAHEIKNPLTPMKLSMQYLQKAIDSNQPNVKELSANVAGTLIEQIDHLSKIAADFSQFANIGYASAELFDLHEVLGSLLELYQTNPNVRITHRALPYKLQVMADKTQMNRLFTNLFANAVEACDGKECHINVNEMMLDNGVVRISVSDNGEGIPDEMKSRIFVPNFTTKSSGTGLGLAMCKGIVEQAQGRIWFETQAGRGTTFHVELPLAE
ncbi:MAG TPA: ATP-binding protein [Chitinophagaceae bacterium]|nr:ATP-binding protein [Chitinophagaceae bacterium]